MQFQNQNLERLDRALLKGMYTNNRIELENPPIVVNPERKLEIEKKNRNKVFQEIEDSI